MRTTFLIFIFLIIQSNANTLFAKVKLSDQAQISLITCAPGTELYALFGHTAIRVRDPQRRYDKAFNYGIFDFDTPNFMVKFIRGKLLYKLGVQDMRRFDYSYKIDKRPYVEQVFNFNQEQKDKVFNYLLNNAKPENCEYKYDFFFDNCSSRVRDVLDESLGDELQLPAAGIYNEYNTYRKCLDYYLSGNNVLGKPDYNTWTDFGMDLILGIPADQKSDLLGQMYLPEFLSQNLSKAKINSTDALLDNWNTIAKKTFRALPPKWYFPTPLKVFSLILIVSIVLFFSKKSKIHQVLHGLLFVLLGLSGWLFLFMWLVTDHEVCHQNLNMIWMNPFHLFLGIQIFRNRISGFWKKYMWVAMLLNVFVLLGWRFLPQEFHLVSIPIILTSCVSLYYYLKEAK